MKDADKNYKTYSVWKRERRLNSKQLELYRNHLEALGNTPAFKIIIDFDVKPDFNALATTISSLANQHLRPAGYCVISRLEAPHNVLSLGISWQGKEAGLDGLSEWLGADDWVLFLTPGDTLDPACILFLTELASRRSQLSAITFDDASCSAREEAPRFKPCFSIDYLRSYNYIGPAVSFRVDSLKDVAFESEFNSNLFIYAALLQLHSQIGNAAFEHIPSVLLNYSLSDAFPEGLTFEQQAPILQQHFAQLGEHVSIIPGLGENTCRIVRALKYQPKVSILIPTRDQIALLQRCLESLIEKTHYSNYEIIIIDNDSQEAASIAYLEGLKALNSDTIRVLPHPGAFNFSEMNNRAAELATGEYLLFLNNDTAALHGDWLETMLSHAQRPEVGIVGARLIHDDGTIQHAGVIAGMSRAADHPWFGLPATTCDKLMRLQSEQNYSAVTAACMMISKSLFFEIGQFDQVDFKVLFNDVDLCFKARQRGSLVVWTPYATLIHDGSASLRNKHVERINIEAKARRTEYEINMLMQRWSSLQANDPYFSPNFALHDRKIALSEHPTMDWNPLPWHPIPRILGAPADLVGCGYYRIIWPLDALHIEGKSFGAVSTRRYTPIELSRANMDTLVVQRVFSRPQINALAAHRKYSDTFIVFDIDDLLTDIPNGNPSQSDIAKFNIRHTLPEAMSYCHRLIVSTEPLLQAYGKYVDDVRVVPNRIRRSTWGHLSPLRAPRRRPRVGWAGGNSHRPDLLILSTVIEQLKSEVDWVFLGFCPKQLRPYLAEYHPGVSIDEYPAKLASLDLDLALAPLKMNAFNECKSNIKILEYGILGYPIICTDITPYQGDAPVTRVKNTPSDWIKAIREHLSDRDELMRRGNTLRQYVHDNWILEDHLDEWVSAWSR